MVGAPEQPRRDPRMAGSSPRMGRRRRLVALLLREAVIGNRGTLITNRDSGFRSGRERP